MIMYEIKLTTRENVAAMTAVYHCMRQAQQFAETAINADGRANWRAEADILSRVFDKMMAAEQGRYQT